MDRTKERRAFSPRTTSFNRRERERKKLISCKNSVDNESSKPNDVEENVERERESEKGM